MKRIIISVFALLLVFSLAGCGRKNSAKNFKIDSHKDSTFVIKYCQDDLEFGEFYMTITDEALVNFYAICTNKDYKVDLSKCQLLVGDLSASFTVSTEDTKKGTKTVFTLTNPLKFIKEVDDEGYETVNEKTIKIYCNYVDVNTPEDTETEVDGLIDDSFISISTNCEDLCTFVRNKAIKVKETE